MATTGLTNWRLLDVARFNRIIGVLAAELDIRRPLVWLERLPQVDVAEDELIGRFTGRVIAADLIADDQEAAVYQNMQLEVKTTHIPNVKIGTRLGQRLLNRLDQLERTMTTGGENALRDWDMAVAENLVLGVRQRLNAIAAAMYCDSLTYSRLGVQITGATWGMPSDLKVTVGTAWGANPTTATPITDILSVQVTARQKYGIEFDRITMSTQDLLDMVATTEFANKVSIMLGANFLVTPAAIVGKDVPTMRNYVGRLLNMDVEIDDAVYYTRANDGTLSAANRALPLHKVVLDRKDLANLADMANAPVTERLVNNLTGQIDGLTGDGAGPIGYYTARPDLNPPDVVAWAVQRAFPRRHQPEISSALTVG